ncbi:MAG TPA: hypothetical protein PLL66_01980 [Bacteroidales bacterium]|nr:hypothetical protein [Bacteroidales bacterium]
MKAKYFITLVMTVLTLGVVAQEENDGGLGEQTIIIYNEYTPVLKDATRMQFLPVIVDTVKITPVFEYSVQPALFKTRFSPSPITAASVKGEPLRPLDNGLIKIGFGNYLSPLVEVYYNNRRSRDYSIGAFAKHHSSFGSIKNSADQRIYSGFNNSQVNAYGKKYFYSSTISGDIDFKSNQIHYYGYNPNIILGSADAVKPFKREEMEMQRYNRLKANFGIVSNNTSKKRMNYTSNIAYQYFFTFTDDIQHKIDFRSDLNKLVKNNRYGMDIGFLFNNNQSTLSNYNDINLDLNPYFKHYTKSWQIQIGVNTTGEFGGDSVRYHFYPNVYFQHNISNTIIPYAGFKGYIRNNNLEYISSINPFVNNLNNIKVTNYAQVIDLGLKGNISKNIYFHINGNYSKIDDMAFFVNDITSILDNKFVMEYTNVERFAGYGEISVDNIGSFSFILKGHYYYYSYIKNRQKPWHMPNVDVSLNANYKLNEKIDFGINVNFIGNRWAKSFAHTTDHTVYPDGLSWHEIQLKPIIDVSLYGEYKFASNFYAFLNMNNITGQKQYVWNNYMSQGFNLMLGIKYLF